MNQEQAEIENEDAELHTTEEAAAQFGVCAGSFANWVKAANAPFEKKGNLKLFEQSTIDKIRQLRDEHGRKWAAHSPWHEPEQDSQAEESSEETDLAGRLLTRARDLYAKGSKDAACEMVFAVLEESQIIAPMQVEDQVWNVKEGVAEL